MAGDTNNRRRIRSGFAGGHDELVSVGAITNANPPTAIPRSSESPEITPDGRYVVFYSTATNLVPGVRTAGEIYVRDLVAGNTIWASTNARAIFQTVTGGTNIVSCNYSISDDGQFVAFEACTNMPSGLRRRGESFCGTALSTGSTDIISTNANVPDFSPELIHNLALTPDGHFVAFVAEWLSDERAIYRLGRGNRHEYAGKHQLWTIPSRPPAFAIRRWFPRRPVGRLYQLRE